MSEKRVVYVDGVTGQVRGVWSGAAERQPATPEGLTAVDATAIQGPDPDACQRWTGTEFEALPPRIISVRDFRRRFSDTEQETLEALGEQQTQVGRRVRLLMGNVTAGPYVDLDHGEVAQGLQQLKPLFIAQGVWADESAANARIAQIMA